jgi:hypothetical protein
VELHPVGGRSEGKMAGPGFRDYGSSSSLRAGGAPQSGLFGYNAQGGGYRPNWETEDLEALTAGQRGQLLVTNERLDDHTQRLARAQRTAIETEEIGHEIQKTLHEDGEKLRRAHDKLHGVDDGLKSTRSILFGMSRRVITNKIILIFIILLLLAGIGVICYLKWGKGLIKKV